MSGGHAREGVEGNPQQGLLLKVRRKVGQWLSTMVDRHEIRSDGTYSARFEATNIAISVEPLLKDQTMIQMRTPLLFDSPRSPDLFEWVADRNNFQRAGYLKAIPSKNKVESVHIFFTYELLGDHVDFEEFKFAFSLAAAAASTE